MSHKLSTEGFTYYVSLGSRRSYQAVAEFFGVDKRTVTRRAQAESWQSRLEKIERQAIENTEKKLVGTLEEANERHLKVLRFILTKAIDTLRSLPMKTATDAVRAIDVCVRHERLILGEPSERTAVKVEDLIRREYERWMTTDELGGLVEDNPRAQVDGAASQLDDDPTGPSLLEDPADGGSNQESESSRSV